MVLTAGNLSLDPTSRRVTRADTEIALTPREFSLLEFFLQHAGTAVTKTQILDGVWDAAFEGDANVVEVYVRYSGSNSMRRSNATASRPFVVSVIDLTRPAVELRVVARKRQANHEACTARRRIGHLDGATVSAHDLTDNRQAQAAPTAVAAAAGVQPNEPIEDAVAIRRGDPITVVLDDDFGAVDRRPHREPNLRCGCKRRIVDQISDHLSQSDFVPHDARGRNVYRDVNPIAASPAGVASFATMSSRSTSPWRNRSPSSSALARSNRSPTSCSIPSTSAAITSCRSSQARPVGSEATISSDACRVDSGPRNS